MSSDADKAVILARGLGTRMQKPDDDAELDSRQAAVARTGVKAMMPVGEGRCFLDYVLCGLADAGYGRICMVLGPEHEEAREYFRSLDKSRISIEFAVQEEPLGTADAVLAAEQFAGDDYFLTVNSDNYYPTEALAALRKLPAEGLAVFDRDSMMESSNISAERITKFAVVRTDSDDNLQEIIEKPDADAINSLPAPVCVSMNCWRFGPAIFEACRAIEPSPRGELEVTDAVQHCIDNLGRKFRVLPFEAAVLDMSSRADVSAVAEQLKGVDVRL